MSPCPSCGRKAVHYGVVVPWETQEAPDVLHKCACGLLFIEPAKDVPAMFAKVEWWVQGFDPDSIQEATLRPLGFDEEVQAGDILRTGPPAGIFRKAEERKCGDKDDAEQSPCVRSKGHSGDHEDEYGERWPVVKQGGDSR